MLIIEDGSVVADANSFVTDLEYTDYAASKGLTIAATAELREIDLFAGVDYLSSKEFRMQGCRVSSEQTMSYPRSGVVLYGFWIDSGSIPSSVKYAQMEAAAYNTAAPLLTNSKVTNTQTEKLDTMLTTYFKGGESYNVNLQRVDVYLRPLLTNINSLVKS